jgi:hypothetical protein
MELDWSAMALQASENAGVDVSDSIETSSAGIPDELKPAALMAARNAGRKKWI